MKNPIRSWIVRKWIPIIVFSTSGVISIAQTTTLNYNVDVYGVNVGNMQATKEIDGNKTTITINSSSEVNFLGTHKITTSIVAVINDGLLQSSNYTSKKNGKPFENTVITKNNGVYKISQQGKDSAISRPIKQVTCDLYFAEPTTNKSYFDVTTGAFSSVEQTGLNTFTYIDHTSNKETTYIYSNNMLYSGTTKYTWYKFSFTRKD